MCLQHFFIPLHSFSPSGVHAFPFIFLSPFPVYSLLFYFSALVFSLTRWFVTECPSSSGKPSLNDIHIVNLSLVSDVQVKKEVSPTTNEPPQSLNLQRLNTRVRNQIDEKKRMVKALQAGVSPEGQKLFITISKTIKEISWSGPNIVVFDKITIIPPYKIENVQKTGDSDEKAFNHIKKVVSFSCPNYLFIYCNLYKYFNILIWSYNIIYSIKSFPVWYLFLPYLKKWCNIWG